MGGLRNYHIKKTLFITKSVFWFGRKPSPIQGSDMRPMVDLKRLELSTSRMRTERSPS